MRICSKCGKDWPTEGKFPFRWKDKCKCGSKDSYYRTRDGTMRSSSPVYDG